MKNILGLLFLLLMIFASCEGRRNPKQALAESIKEFKKTVNVETNVYIPETYVEMDVDSLLSNGFRVKIKAYSDMSNSVHFSVIKDTINHQTYYRNFKFDISVTKDDKLIYNESFDKQKANKIFNYNSNLTSGSLLYNFDTLAVLKSIQINDNSDVVNSVAIDILYTIPESDKFSAHTLFIDEKGKLNSVQIEVN